jgi:hypothetical protein
MESSKVKEPEQSQLYQETIKTKLEALRTEQKMKMNRWNSNGTL